MKTSDVFKSILAFSFMLLLPVFFVSCGDDEEDENGNSKEYKKLMREFVQNISEYAKNIDPDFIVIPQNGHELMREEGEETGDPVMPYIQAIYGAGQEDLFYGYDDDNAATPSNESDYLMIFLDAAKNNGVQILVTDYCWDHNKMDDSFDKNSAKGYISFAAPERDLNIIPDYPDPIIHENSNNIETLSSAQNFLYLLDPYEWNSKDSFLLDIQATNYDVIIMDAFFDDVNMLTADDVNSLKTKNNGGSRLVISYMSIGEAEDYRYYWNEDWEKNPPSWLAKDNPEWEGN